MLECPPVLMLCGPPNISATCIHEKKVFFLVQIKDSKLFLVQSLGRLSQKHPGQIGPLIRPQGAAQSLLTQLQGLLQAAGVTVA